jgi:hypothetical protein
MPPRFLTLAIIAFWLSMMSWVFYTDVWPLWQSEKPPSFTVDLADEARGLRSIHWTVRKNGKSNYRAESWVKYRPEDDTYEIHNVLQTPSYHSREQPAEGPTISKVQSMVRISADGDLRSLESIIGASLPVNNQQFSVEGSIEGEVRDGHFYPHVRVPEFDLDKQLEPVELSRRGSILNPLQPFNRLVNLQVGQRWEVPLFDPMEEAFSSLVPGLSHSTRILRAEVSSGTLRWGGKDVPCLVVTYEGDDVTGHTWVRLDDGLVLKQEMTMSGDVWEMERETFP